MWYLIFDRIVPTRSSYPQPYTVRAALTEENAVPLIFILIQACFVGLVAGETRPAPARTVEKVECRPGDGYVPAVPVFSGSAASSDTMMEGLALSMPTRLAGAVHAEAAKKTFFAWLTAPRPVAQQSRPEGENADAGFPLRVSWFDHSAGTVARPCILPIQLDTGRLSGLSMELDEAGHVWLVVSLDPGSETILLKSTKPYDITAFTRHAGPAMSNARLYHVAGQGALLLGLRPGEKGPAVSFATSADGMTWSEPRQLAAIGAGHTFVCGQHKDKIGVALAAWQDGEKPLDATNVYYLETVDAGKTWRNIRRQKQELPVRGQDNPSLAFDYHSIDWTVLPKDINFDPFGNPTILYLTGRPARRNTPPVWIWTTIRWIGREWETTGILGAGGPHDAGALYMEPDRSWRLITARNHPKVSAKHEEIVLWSTDDQGRSWYKQAEIDAPGVHAIARPADPRPELYALWIWGPDTDRGMGVEPAAEEGRSDARGSIAPPTGRLLILDRAGSAAILPADSAAADQKPQALTVATQPSDRP